ncbi:MAG: BirA family transcriptional regulator [Gaiellaceae bacterium]|nr:BirA family transcriptional regulator [Gaiellaceae bacterium]
MYAERCPSTQRLLAGDAPEGAVAVADEQTQGRGRMGRMWVAPPGTSLLLSVRLRPEVAPERLPTLTVVAADAVCEVVAGLGLEASVKAPNDVLVADRKVAGVLAEASAGRVTLGIGLNVSQRLDELPERPVFPATSLELELGSAPERSDLLVELLLVLERRYDAWRLAG